MMRPLILLACLVAAAHSVAEVASSQPVVIRGEATCRKCSIERQLIVRIGEANDELINGPVVSPVVRDSRGRFFVIDQDRGPVKVFASVWKVFDATRTRRGRGQVLSDPCASILMSAHLTSA